MTLTEVNCSLTSKGADREAVEKQHKAIMAELRTVVRILTAEQALLAQKVVRETGGRRGP